MKTSVLQCWRVMVPDNPKSLSLKTSLNENIAAFTGASVIFRSCWVRIPFLLQFSQSLFHYFILCKLLTKFFILCRLFIRGHAWFLSQCPCLSEQACKNHRQNIIRSQSKSFLIKHQKWQPITFTLCCLIKESHSIQPTLKGEDSTICKC